MPPQDFLQMLQLQRQEHLLDGWESLSGPQQEAFGEQLRSIDWALLSQLRQEVVATSTAVIPGSRAERAKPPQGLLRLPRSPDETTAWNNAITHGEELLHAGRVGVLLVAGGQGTRLGITTPKGMFPIGPVTGKSLYQLLSEQVLARGKRYGKSLPYYIMTSQATHDPTVAFWKEQQHFGLDPQDVRFFRQGNMPAVDAQSFRLLCSGPGQLALSPDGHGGVLQALLRANLFTEMRERGIDYLYYHQVDNPFAIVADPAFLGWHLLQQSEMSTKVVAKTGSREKMGVVVDIDSVTQIVEYSDLPNHVADRCDSHGQLELWAGSTAMHVFNRDFLERMAHTSQALPYHIARKVVPYYEPGKEIVVPSSPNAFKFERFIFDILPHARNPLVLEADRTREFNPVKNATGVNSPEDVQQSLVAMYRAWLDEAKISHDPQRPVEISSWAALDRADVLKPAFQHVAVTDTGPAGQIWEA